jgi:hypothetical protein
LTVKRALFAVVGIVSLGIGLFGVFVPLLPTTPFLLLAAACFLRSSTRLHRWLITHRWFGPYIRNYQEHRAITTPARAIVLLLLWGTLAYAAFMVVDNVAVRVLLLVVGLAVTTHIVMLRTMTREMARKYRERDEES